jgi:hypothetical protein
MDFKGKIALNLKELCDHQYFVELLIKHRGNGSITAVEPDMKKRGSIVREMALLGSIKEIKLPAMGKSERKKLYLNPEWKPNYSNNFPEYVTKKEAAILLGIGRTYFHLLFNDSRITDPPFEIRPNSKREVISQQKLYEWAKSISISPANSLPLPPNEKIHLLPNQLGLEVHRLMSGGTEKLTRMKRLYNIEALTTPHHLVEYARFAAPLIDLDECVPTIKKDSLCAVQFTIELRDYNLLTDSIISKLQEAAFESLAGIYLWVRLISQSPTDIAVAVKKMRGHIDMVEELQWVSAMLLLDCLPQNEKILLNRHAAKIANHLPLYIKLANPILEKYPEPVFDYRSVYCDDDLLRLYETGAAPDGEIVENTKNNPYYVMAKQAKSFWNQNDNENRKKGSSIQIDRKEAIQSEITRSKRSIAENRAYIAKLEENLKNLTDPFQKTNK